MHTFADMVGLGAIAIGSLVALSPLAVTVKLPWAYHVGGTVLAAAGLLILVVT